eukprot:Tamp_18707.p1 GENE.Tamp_18707~~Tamp_18707.p1  ORF type:complete len:234 (-),score=33.60 Tamp_18707:405-1106(-)
MLLCFGCRGRSAKAGQETDCVSQNTLGHSPGSHAAHQAGILADTRQRDNAMTNAELERAFGPNEGGSGASNHRAFLFDMRALSAAAGAGGGSGPAPTPRSSRPPPTPGTPRGDRAAAVPTSSVRGNDCVHTLSGSLAQSRASSSQATNPRAGWKWETFGDLSDFKCLDDAKEREAFEQLASMASVSAVERLMKKNPNTPPTKLLFHLPAAAAARLQGEKNQNEPAQWAGVLAP